MICPGCKHETNRPAVQLDDLDGNELIVSVREVKVRVTAQVALHCPSCGVQIAEAIAEGDISMTPRGKDWPT